MFSQSEKNIFRNMIEETRRCLLNTKPTTHAGKVNCETAYFSELDSYTYHTHPVGVEYPSDLDKQTTAKHHKKYLAIGIVPKNEVVVWGNAPHYDKLVGRFKV